MSFPDLYGIGSWYRFPVWVPNTAKTYEWSPVLRGLLLHTSL
jgi:hypothetical protein